MRWLILHLPDLACAMVALCAGFPVVLGGSKKISFPAGRTRRVAGGNSFTG